ncbi:K02A2.6-like [Cordylochernes scorpioides]|uniref:K02A2.6-like n=1 Tax=Cordylochernes scorpioides TaxID=51811 RepID=A0ABY6LG32_9ARAC|nr:K02A2.6-like [Cordylochernes scorpioides]
MILGKNAQNVQKITDLIKENPRTTLMELEQDTGISKTTIGRIVTKDLKLKKTPAKFIPRFLTNEQKLCRLATCENMLEMIRTDPEWKDKIITGDETWVYDYDPETKRQYAEWRGQVRELMGHTLYVGNEYSRYRRSRFLILYAVMGPEWERTSVKIDEDHTELGYLGLEGTTPGKILDHKVYRVESGKTYSENFRSLSRIFFELFANCVANLPFRSQAAPLAVKMGDIANGDEDLSIESRGNFIDFELDTGSCLTLISENDFKKYLPNAQLKTIGMIVKTYDGTVVPILGEVIVKVEFQGKTSMLRAVVVKGEKKALLGREWINLLKIDYLAVNQIPSEIAIAEFLKEHQVLFNDTAEPIKGFTFLMNIRDVSLIFHKARPVPFAIRTAVTEALENMVTKGYYRILGYSSLSAPHSARLVCYLGQGEIFLKLDLSSAYLQLEVATSTQPFYLTINTHKGLFRFRRMPFGLANAPSYFQSVMDRVLAGIEGVICYIDDVLIATVSVEKHLAVLKTVFLRLEKYNIKLKKDKCKFVQREIEYLGHLIKEDGIRPLDHKVQALQKAKSLKNISELRSFLGLVNYYGKCIPNLPDLLRPLHELLHKKNCWSWTKECEEAIEKCKSSITSERVLDPYDTTLPLFLATDASQIVIGAVLSHVVGGQ